MRENMRRGMQVQGKARQRGLSFIGLVIVGALIVFVAVIGAKVVPSAIEFQAIRKAADKARAGNTVPEVRAIFDRAAAVDDITSIRGSDLQVSKNGDKVVVSFAYTREFELIAPAFLVMKYSGTAQ